MPLPASSLSIYTNVIAFFGETAQEIKYLLVSVYISLFLYYMVEPALDANVMYWSVWMLVCGLIKGNIQDKVPIGTVG